MFVATHVFVATKMVPVAATANDMGLASWWY